MPSQAVLTADQRPAPRYVEDVIRAAVILTMFWGIAAFLVGVVIAAVLFLAVANGDYLTVYDNPGGQLMLAVIGGVFALGGWLLTRMASIDLPERFTARAVVPGGEP